MVFTMSRIRNGLAGLSLILFACSSSTPPAQAQRRTMPDRSAIVVAQGENSYLGIRMEDVTAADVGRYKLSAERGVIVKGVDKGSPAESAGIKLDDVILEYGSMSVFSAAQLARMVRETPAGRKVEIVVSRDGKRITLSAEIGGRGAGPKWAPNGEGFQFFGPEGRMFQFRIPGGNQFFYDAPGLGGAFGRTRLGVTVEPLTDQMADFLGVKERRGVLVTSVVQDSPAASKLRAGDVIVQADGQNVYGPEDLARIIRDKDDGTVQFKVVREKQELSVSVDLQKTDTTRDRRGLRL